MEKENVKYIVLILGIVLFLALLMRCRQWATEGEEHLPPSLEAEMEWGS